MSKSFACWALLAAVLGTGCSSSGGGSSGSTSNPDIITSQPMGSGTVYSVKWHMNIAEENTGNGQQLSVKVGDSVIWVADDNMMHNVDFTAGSPSIPATSLFGGSSSTKQSPPITFTTAGTWSYVCDIHTVSSMKGTIQVQ